MSEPVKLELRSKQPSVPRGLFVVSAAPQFTLEAVLAKEEPSTESSCEETAGIFDQYVRDAPTTISRSVSSRSVSSTPTCNSDKRCSPEILQQKPPVAVATGGAGASSSSAENLQIKPPVAAATGGAAASSSSAGNLRIKPPVVVAKEALKSDLPLKKPPAVPPKMQPAAPWKRRVSVRDPTSLDAGILHIQRVEIATHDRKCCWTNDGFWHFDVASQQPKQTNLQANKFRLAEAFFVIILISCVTVAELSKETN